MTKQSVRAKIKSLSELGIISQEARDGGKSVVLCHGVFDLLHMGHVRHLEIAKKEGDVLVVTLTADQFVNKGPGRPVFSEQIRAEMLAAIEYVDWVGINYEPTAEPVISAIKPEVYIKGSDYKNDDDDVTGKIVSEREVVELNGGRLHFTDDITFSSSSLINQYLGIYEPTLRGYLDTQRSKGKLSVYFDALEKIKDKKVLLVGDTIIDEYQYVEVMGKAAKENMIATQFKEREVFAGGVIASANHVADFCDNVEVITSFGSHESYEHLARQSLYDNVILNSICRTDAPTTRKCRFVDTGYSMRKMFEVYTMDDRPMSESNTNQLNDLILEKIEAADVVIVNDFGHGLINNKTMQILEDKAKFLAINTQSNGGNYGFNLVSKYRRADFVCIDGPEARLATHDKFSNLEEILSQKLPNVIDCPNIIVTQGKRGCLVMQGDNRVRHVPAVTSSIVDTVGAGDAFFSVAAPLVAAGVDLEDVGFIGNAVGGLKVGIVGHRDSVTKVALSKFLTALMK